MQRVGPVAVIALFALGLSACSGSEPPPGRTVTTTDFLGQPLTQVYSDMGYMLNGPTPLGLGIITYEMSPPITQKPSESGPNDPAIDWTTVAACYTDNPRQLTLGVIPSRDATPQIVANAKDHKYDRFVRECPGTATTFTVPLPTQ